MIVCSSSTGMPADGPGGPGRPGPLHDQNFCSPRVQSQVVRPPARHKRRPRTEPTATAHPRPAGPRDSDVYKGMMQLDHSCQTHGTVLVRLVLSTDWKAVLTSRTSQAVLALFGFVPAAHCKHKMRSVVYLPAEQRLQDFFPAELVAPSGHATHPG